MELHQLRMFYAVAKEGSFTRAADQLHCVQPNVTSWIKRLESELGVQLFVRSKQGTQLSEAGQRIMPYVTKMLRLAEECKRAAQDSPTSGGSVLLGSLESTAAVRLPRAINAFQKRYPEVELGVVTAPTPDLIEKVLQCQLDAALVGGFSKHADLYQEAMLEEELVLTCSFAVDKQSSVEELLEHQPILVCQNGCLFRTKLQHWLDRIGLVSYRVREIATLDGILACVASGLGVSVMSRSLVEEHWKSSSIDVRELPPEISSETIVYIRRKDAIETSASRALLELLRDELQNAPGIAEAQELRANRPKKRRRSRKPQISDMVDSNASHFTD